VLKLHDLRFRYTAADPWAVDEVSFELRRGEVLGLLGPNGAGKTTLMALISGLRRPQQGEIRRAPEVAARAGFALVPQDHAFYPMLTCRENLEFFAGVLGLGGATRRERVDAAIAVAGLSGVARQRAAQCSGGLKRRLNLAIGLVGDPQLLLLDEPTVGVDPQSRAFLLETVRNLRTRGKTVVYTSHYMEEVQAVSDRVAIMDHGRLLCCGALDAILAEANPRLLVRPAGPLAGPVRAALIAGWGLDPAAGDGGWLSFAVPAGRPVEAVLAELRKQGVSVIRFVYGNNNLEDVFLKLTHRSLRD
jgi:ABC-2 type transport system ATP-binding protein